MHTARTEQDASASDGGYSPLDLTEEDLATARPDVILPPAKPAPEPAASSFAAPQPAPGPGVDTVSAPPAEPTSSPADGNVSTPPTEQPDAVTAEIAAARARRGTLAKKAAVYLAVAALALTVWRTFAPSPAQASTATTIGSTSQAAVAPPSSVIDADMATARTYLTEHGTLEGIVLDGAQLAVRGTTMYAARLLDGDCVVYGILDGRDLVATTDATAAACTGQIVTVQAQLDQAAQQQQVTAATQARAALEQATTAAQYYASRNFVDGAQSFAGLPAQVEGAAVAANAGDWVTLQVALPDTCQERTISSAGDASAISECTS